MSVLIRGAGRPGVPCFTFVEHRVDLGLVERPEDPAVVGEGGRGVVADAQALGELDGQLAVGRGLARLDRPASGRRVRAARRRRGACTRSTGRSRPGRRRWAPAGRTRRSSSCRGLRPAEISSSSAISAIAWYGTQRRCSWTMCRAGRVDGPLARVARDVARGSSPGSRLGEDRDQRPSVGPRTRISLGWHRDRSILASCGESIGVHRFRGLNGPARPR